MTGDATESVVALMPRPPEPTPGSRSWEEVEADLHVRFPLDLRSLLEISGQGLVGGGFELLDPRNPLRYWSIAGVFLDAMRDLGHEESEHPLPPFPSEGPSLLPIGINGSSDVIYLVVSEGQACEDPLWIGNISADAWIEVKGPVAAVVLRALEGRFDGRNVLGPSNWRLAPLFEPIRDP